MCFDDTCIPYCARAENFSSTLCKDYWKSLRPSETKDTGEETGEVCVNVEYNGKFVPKHSRSTLTSVGGGKDVVDIDVPGHFMREEEDVCVNVYNDDLADASMRLNDLVGQKKEGRNWQNVKQYCMYGATRLFMSVFKPASLAYSDQYCGKTGGESSSNDNNVSDTTDTLTGARDGFLRQYYENGSWIAGVNAASLSAKR